MQALLIFVVIVSAFVVALRSKSKFNRYFSTGAVISFSAALCVAAMYHPNRIGGLPLDILGVTLVVGLVLMTAVALRTLRSGR